MSAGSPEEAPRPVPSLYFLPRSPSAQVLSLVLRGVKSGSLKIKRRLLWGSQLTVLSISLVQGFG